MGKELFKSATPAKVDLALSSTEDRIAAYYVGEIEKSDLSKRDQEIAGRWLNIWNSLNNYRSPQQAVNEHMRKYENLGNPVSLRTAWNDLRGATKLWGSIGRTSQQARYILLYEMAMKTFNLATTEKNTQDMVRALKELREINKLMKDEGDETLKPSLYVLQINMPGAEQKTINLNDLAKVEDAEFEEIVKNLDEGTPDDAEIHQMLNGDQTSKI